MIKYLGNKTISFDIEELLKNIDVNKVAFINDASRNLCPSADSYREYEKLFNIIFRNRIIFYFL